jgi:copper chaperone CopZ
VTQTRTTLTTHNIKCEGCATAARTALAKLPGVGAVEFDLPGKTATVTHDDDVQRTDLARTLAQAGFPSE